MAVEGSNQKIGMQLLLARDRMQGTGRDRGTLTITNFDPGRPPITLNIVFQRERESAFPDRRETIDRLFRTVVVDGEVVHVEKQSLAQELVRQISQRKISVDLANQVAKRIFNLDNLPYREEKIVFDKNFEVIRSALAPEIKTLIQHVQKSRQGEIMLALTWTDEIKVSLLDAPYKLVYRRERGEVRISLEKDAEEKSLAVPHRMLRVKSFAVGSEKAPGPKISESEPVPQPRPLLCKARPKSVSQEVRVGVSFVPLEDKQVKGILGIICNYSCKFVTIYNNDVRDKLTAHCRIDGNDFFVDLEELCGAVQEFSQGEESLKREVEKKIKEKINPSHFSRDVIAREVTGEYIEKLCKGLMEKKIERSRAEAIVDGILQMRKEIVDQLKWSGGMRREVSFVKKVPKSNKDEPTIRLIFDRGNKESIEITSKHQFLGGEKSIRPVLTITPDGVVTECRSRARRKKQAGKTVPLSQESGVQKDIDFTNELLSNGVYFILPAKGEKRFSSFGENIQYLRKFCPGGDFSKRTLGGNFESPQFKKNMAAFLGIMHAMHQMHGEGFIHRDFKPENILFEVNDVPRLIDFGKMVQEGDKMKVDGTFGYIAPECFSEGVVSPKCDMFSVGITLLQLFFEKCPFDNSQYKFCMNQQRDYEAFQKEFVGEIGSFLNTFMAKTEADPRLNAVKDLIKDLLSVDPTERPSAVNVYTRLLEIFPEVRGLLDQMIIDEIVRMHHR